MIHSVSERFSRLDKLKSEAEEMFSRFSDEELNMPQAPGKWGAIQHFAHILSSETLSLMYMKKKIQGVSEAGKSGLSERVRSGLLRFAMKTSLKFKAPPVLEEPASFIKKEEFLSKWNNLRNDYREFLEPIKEDIASSRIYKHPVMGRMDLLQALDFLGVHLERHLKSAKEILAKR
jgi:hypothetical protein